MARHTRKTLWSRAFKRGLATMTRTAVRAGSQAIAQAMRVAPNARKKRTPVKPRLTSDGNWSAGVAIGAAGARRYRLYKPLDLRPAERLPLVVILHGCRQDAEALAASSKMNRIAASERFFVLYPEQDRLSNVQGCWNWYDTRSGRAQGEAGSIAAVIDQICLLQPVDPNRIALAGFSAGAGMAALLATRHPKRFRAIAMHSGIAPGIAHSSATALMAMRGRKVTGVPLDVDTRLPALLVIHGSTDRVVAPSNGAEAARLWAARVDARPSIPRTIQRGARYPVTIIDYRFQGRLIATFCEVNGLGHAWSGGAAGHAHSDPKGPDASRMIWAFVAKQFA